MSRGYRSIIVALIGWLILAASPPHPNGQQPEQTAKPKQEQTKLVAPAKESIETANLNEPCEQGRDDRKSDLCAQWKAADAAKSASDATWLFGALGSLIGGLTLAAAWSAAYYAKQASYHTLLGATAAEKTNTEMAKQGSDAKKASYEGLRPHIGIFRIYLSESLDEIWIIFKNFGQTPAINAYAETSVTNAIPFEWSKDHDFGLIDPGSETPARIKLSSSISLLACARNPDQRPTVTINLTYGDRYGHRHTRVAYYLLGEVTKPRARKQREFFVENGISKEDTVKD